jgi:hypothetical protein
MIDARNQLDARGLSRRPGYSHRRYVAAIFITAVIVLSLLPFASCSPESTPLDTAGEPRISFEEHSIHLGPAHPGEKVSAEFEFRNAGDADLVISEITAASLAEGC